MFKVIINGIKQALNPGFVVQLVYRSPLFNELNSRTSPMSFSGRNLQNKAAFNLPARVEKTEISAPEYDGYFEFGPIKQVGRFTLEEASDTNIEALMLFDKANFNDAVENKTLRELNYATINIGNDTQAIADYINPNIDKKYPDVGFNFPKIYAPEFYGDKNEQFDGYLNNYNQYAGIIVNEVAGSVAINRNAIVPCFFSFWILEEIYKQFGYTFLRSNLAKHAEFQQLNIINNYALDKFSSSYYVFAGMSTAQHIYGTAIVNINKDWLDGYEDNNDIFFDKRYKISDTGLYRIKFNYQYWHFFHDSGWAEVNVKIIKDGDIIYQNNHYNEVGQYVTDEIDFQLTFLTADINKEIWVEITAFDETNNFSSHIVVGIGDIEIGKQGDLNVFDGQISPVNHLPDVSVKAFIKDLETVCGAIFLVDDNSKTVTPVFWEDVLKSNKFIDFNNGIVFESRKVDYVSRVNKFKLGYSDQQESIDAYNRLGDVNIYSDLENLNPEFEDICAVISTNNIYIYREVDGDDPEDWYFLCKNIFDYENGTGKKVDEKLISFEILPMETNSIFSAPQLDGEGTSPAFKLGNKDFSFYMLFYRGLQKNINGINYPLATPLKTGIYNDLEIIGEKSLIPRDIAEQCWIDYIRWILNTKLGVNYEKNFTPEELNKLAYDLKCRISGVNYLVGSVELGVKINRLTKANIKLFKV